jgi:hypothetical protein
MFRKVVAVSSTSCGGSAFEVAEQLIVADTLVDATVTTIVPDTSASQRTLEPGSAVTSPSVLCTTNVVDPSPLALLPTLAAVA